ncbi:MAG: dihydroorotate dehydrogenase-like protein [Bacteroidia bacterium]|nr:dihydroorotate dehydrogenase-like protein [Bacteroidia bacterium]
MINLKTNFMGLELKNPVIAGSSGLTNTIDNIRQLAEHGAGAVVLKSIFEEQIRFETDKLLASENENIVRWKSAFESIVEKRSYDYAEALDYMSNYAREHTLNDYLKFISEAKKSVDIPVIASINCISAYDWSFFARRIQEAGADALELNVYVLPSNPLKDGQENEQIYFDVIREVKKHVSVPVSLKIGYYFSGLSKKVIELSNTGISSLVLFNRPYSPDIDIEKMEISSANILSTPAEYSHTLRWVGILSGRLGCQIAASTGIHDAETAIRNILAGADVVQVASALYRNGFSQIEKIVGGIENWMNTHHYASIDQFRGKMSQKNMENPSVFERVQFMKLYSKIE